MTEFGKEIKLIETLNISKVYIPLKGRKAFSSRDTNYGLKQQICLQPNDQSRIDKIMGGR